MKLASLDSSEESTLPAGWPGKLLILIQNSEPACRGGFQVDSPVRNPVASEIAHSAPPYTDRATEEPWEGVHPDIAIAQPAERLSPKRSLRQAGPLSFPDENYQMTAVSPKRTQP